MAGPEHGSSTNSSTHHHHNHSPDQLLANEHIAAAQLSEGKSPPYRSIMKKEATDFPGGSVASDTDAASPTLTSRLSMRRVSFAEPWTQSYSSSVQSEGSGDSQRRESANSVQSQESGGSQRTESANDRDVFEDVDSPQKIFFVQDSDSETETDSDLDGDVFGRGDERDDILDTKTRKADRNSRKDNMDLQLELLEELSEKSVKPCPGTGHGFSDFSDNQVSDLSDSQNFSDEFTSTKSTRQKSAPIPIDSPRSTTASGLASSCRGSNTQVYVRCQFSPCGSHMPHSFSCPAFSPKWKDVMPSQPRSRDLPPPVDRPLRRRYTVSNYAEFEKQQQRRQKADKKLDTAKDSDWQNRHGPAFVQSRSRSYSDTDVNTRMMKEVGRELRRISDAFHFSYTGRRLNTVCESAETEDDEHRHYHPSSCP